MTAQHNGITELYDILARGRTVTENYEKAFGNWSIGDQFDHIKDEVREFEHSLHFESLADQLEEGCDVIYTVITAFHQLNFSDEQIVKGLQKTLRKIERRCKQRTSKILGEIHN